MTEYNIFCYAEEYNNKDSFQQKQYRAFNKVVGLDRYYEIKNKIAKILNGLKLELKKNGWSDEWKKVTSDQWEKLFAIPEAKDFKEGFEYISGVKINLKEKDEDVEEALKLLKKRGIIKNGKLINL